MAKIKLQGEEEKRKNIYYEVDTAIPPIGEGGMGKVMKGKCVDIATGVSRPVAIKFLYSPHMPLKGLDAKPLSNSATTT